MKQINLLLFNRILFKVLPYISKLLSIDLLSRLLIITAHREKYHHPTNKNKFNILVINVPGGDLDIYESMKFSNTSYEFIFLPKSIFDIIYKSFRGYIKPDWAGIEDINKSENYNIFIEKLFNLLKKKFNLTAIVTFNFIYQSIHPLNNFSINKNVPVILYYKECFRTPKTFKLIEQKINQININYLSKITLCVQNRDMYDVLGNIFKKKKIINLVGQARSTSSINYFNINNEKPKKINNIIFFSISPKAGFPNFQTEGLTGITDSCRNYIQNIDLSIYNRKIYKILFNFFEENPDLNSFIIKSKKNLVTFPVDKKVKILSGGPRLDLVSNNSLVIACNSTAIIESLIRGATCIHFAPYDTNIADSREFFHKFNNTDIIECNSLSELNVKLNYLFENKDLKLKKIDRSKLIDRYLFNSDGKAGQRFWKVLSDTCKIN